MTSRTAKMCVRVQTQMCVRAQTQMCVRVQTQTAVVLLVMNPWQGAGVHTCTRYEPSSPAGMAHTHTQSASFDYGGGSINSYTSARSDASYTDKVRLPTPLLACALSHAIVISQGYVCLIRDAPVRTLMLAAKAVEATQPFHRRRTSSSTIPTYLKPDAVTEGRTPEPFLATRTAVRQLMYAQAVWICSACCVLCAVCKRVLCTCVHAQDIGRSMRSYQW